MTLSSGQQSELYKLELPALLPHRAEVHFSGRPVNLQDACVKSPLRRAFFMSI